MGKRGPVKEPTRKRMLRGNPSKTAIPKGEPKFQDTDVACPDFLCAEAKAEWKRRYPELKSNGLICPAYMAAFAAYCDSWAHWVRLVRECDKHEDFADTGKGIFATPYLKQKRMAWEMMVKSAREFGLTPSSSADLGVKGQNEPQDEFSQYLQKKAGHG